MAERAYGHRAVVEKLGIRPGVVAAFANSACEIYGSLVEDVLARSGRPPAGSGERADVVLVAVDGATDAPAELERWKPRLQPAGGIWLLTPKRELPAYVNQNELIRAGESAGLVDNKVCSVSEETSGMRFVIRREDRVYRAG